LRGAASRAVLLCSRPPAVGSWFKQPKDADLRTPTTNERPRSVRCSLIQGFTGPRGNRSLSKWTLLWTKAGLVLSKSADFGSRDGGIRPTFGKLALDFGFWEYYYPGGQCFNDAAVGGLSCSNEGAVPTFLPDGNVVKADVSFWEVYGKATYTVSDNFSFGGSAFYSPSVLNSGAEGTYAATTAKYTVPNAPLPAGVGVFISADLGHWFLGTSDSFYCTQVAGLCGGAFPTGIPYKSYTTWDAGLAFTYKVFTLDLRYFDTNMNKGDCNAFTSDHTASGIAVTPINPFPDPGSSWCGASFIAKLSVDMTAAANLK
jgi:hypothetical protein